MDTSRQLYAVIILITTSTICSDWWFAFARCQRAVIFLALAIIYTVAAVFAADNLYLAFADQTFIHFSSSHTQMTYFTALSYIQAGMWVVEAAAYLLLARWIVQRFGRKKDAS